MLVPESSEHETILIKYKRKIGDLLKMGVLDKFLSIMKLDDGDDEYDDDEFFDDDEYDDDYEEKPKRSLFHKSTKDNDKDFDENDEEEYTAPVKQKSSFSNNKVTPMRQPARRSSVNMEVCVIRPTSMEDTREIADTLVDNSTVVLNLEGLDMELAQRIIDFTSGACYSLGGSLQKVSSYIFILGPYNVDITGDLQNILGSNPVPSVRAGY